jgi:serine/threonine protein kinase
MVAVKLSHGNLVTVFDAGHSDDQIYLAMDFIDGKDLLATWNRCAQRGVPFPVEVAAYIVKELARGLGYAHAFGGLNLVHRDVSPANVLLSYSGEVKLTDFGLATSTLKLQQTAPGIIFGKLSYLAPEQARREHLDGRTDLYVCGILLWELLTGQQLFPVKAAAFAPGKNDSTADALERVRNPRPISPSQITDRVAPELDRIVMKALQPNPADRYQTGEELRADLGAFLAKTAPETDADRLAKFLKVLFEKDTDNERREREEMVRGASHFLSGAGASRSMGYTVPHSPNARATPVPGMRAQPLPHRAPSDAHAEGREDARDDSHPRVVDQDKDPRVGTTVAGRYYLRRLCGEGAMGRVYEGQHIDIGRRVAVKILQSSYRHTPELVERFRREARSASRIGHPNIVDVTDSGTTDDGAFFFVMEYLEGFNLEDLINREGMLPVERAILIGAQICRALQAAHAVDVIHRDLKPANIMLVNRKEDEDFVKVLDFGISKTLDLDDGRPRRQGLTNPDVAVGTPVYMSPEQAAGMPADARTDVYAVGGLLYEMLTACPPCEGEDILAILNKKASEDPRPPRELRPGIPADLEAVVMRALSRFANDRQPSMEALKDDLVRCLTTLKGAPSRVSLTQDATGDSPQQTLRIRHVINSHPWILGVGTGALVVFAGLWWFGRGAGEAEVTHARAVRAPGAPATPAARAPSPVVVAAAAPAPAAPARWPEPSRPIFPEPAASAPVVEPIARAEVKLPSSAPPISARRPTRPLALPSKPATTAPASPPSPRRTATATTLAAAAAPPATSGMVSGSGLLEQAQAAFNAGRYAEAMRRGREALATGGAPLAAHLLLGDVYYHMQRYTQALGEYQAALTLDPDNRLAIRGRELASKQTEPEVP